MERGQRIGLIGAALVVAAVAFLLLSDGDDDEDSRPARTGTQPTLSQEPTAVPAPKPTPEFEKVRVVGGEPAGGVKRITVGKGETVRLEVRSDTAAEVHVHGYELRKDVEAGGSVRFRFKADIEGVFEVELEETHTQIVQLTVEP